jgi:hypothetical protein
LSATAVAVLLIPAGDRDCANAIAERFRRQRLLGWVRAGAARPLTAAALARRNAKPNQPLGAHCWGRRTPEATGPEEVDPLIRGLPQRARAAR